MKTNIVGLFENSDKSTGFIFGENNKYIVPEYQREYSWGEEQIESLMSSIKRAIEEESVFMGTVQFNFYNENSESHIIDGQQRMTTFLLLCSLLGKQSGEDIIDKNNMKLDIRNFDSNNEKLAEALAIKYEDIDGVNTVNNRYVENTKLLKSALEELKKQEYSIERILDAIFNKIYFVELTTEDMALPKVVGIFNTINTTGLDLNCSDLFKLQYYEYLKANYGDSKNWMGQICKAYEEVNKKDKNMRNILDIYKHCIVATDKKLGWEMLSKSNESFFEEIFNNNEYKNAEILRFEKFKKIIEIYLELSEERYKMQPEAAFVEDIIWGTRYGRYWTLPYVIAYFNGQEYNNALNTALCVAKYFIVCSVDFDKAINPVHTFICNTILKNIYNNETNIENIIQKNICETPYERDRETNPNWNNRFIERIRYDLFDNGKRAHIICTLSALLEEEDANTKTYDIMKKLYDWDNFKYDIEHIEAKENFKKFSKDKKKEYNGIGNLVVLNRSINRDIKDDAVAEKVKAYENSSKYENEKEQKFVSIEKVAKQIRDANNSWGIEQVRKRANEEIKKICAFLELEYSEV